MCCGLRVESFRRGSFEYLRMEFAAQKDGIPESWTDSVQFLSWEIEEWMKGIGYDYSDLPR